MSESLNEVIKRLKEQNSQVINKPVEVKKPVQKQEFNLPEADELASLENEDGEIVNDFEEDLEENEDKSKKEGSQKPKESQKSADLSNDTQKIAEIIRDLQDNGIYRLRVLTMLEKMSQSFVSLDQNIKSLCEYLALRNDK